MAGRYHRSYGRKKASAPPISQFDRLITEAGKSTHPVAAKTAGHVGKWGMTSFTSLRSINGGLGKEDTVKRVSSLQAEGGDDPFNFESEKGDVKKASSKRRKFFKSRDAALSPEPPPDRSLSSIEGEARHAKENKETKPGGGIKLKIFKSRNSDMNSSDTYSSTVHLPSDDSSNSSNCSNGKLGPPSECILEKKRKFEPLQIKHHFDDSDDLLSGTKSRKAVGKHKEKSPDKEISYYGLNDTVGETRKHRKNKEKVPIRTVSLLRQNYNFDEAKDYKTRKAVSKSKEVSEVKQTSQVEQCDLFESKNSVAIPVGDISVISDEVSISPAHFNDTTMAIDHQVAEKSSPVHESKSNYHDDPPVTSQTRTMAIKNGSLSEMEKAPPSPPKNLNLFSSDFDENDIIDRTSIDYNLPLDTSELAIVDDVALTRSDTLNLDALCDFTPAKRPSCTGLDLPDLSVGEIHPISEDALPDPATHSYSSFMKKKSIFKSRQNEGDAKTRATYRHKWHGHEEKDTPAKKDSLEKAQSAVYDIGDDPFQFGSLPSLTRTQTWPSLSQERQPFSDDIEGSVITGMKCPKPMKKFYTVVKNVKKTHQLQESGEFQEFNDDVDYFLDALKSANTVAMRCLASLNLAQKCMVPAFRMHLRAHATVTKFFRALLDAPSHPYLAECAAMVMFALSQDRLNMDLDRCSLELMLNLLDADSNVGSDMNAHLPDAASVEHANKIKNLCKELQLQGHAKHLKLENINAGALAMETLLSLTSKRAGEWFKEELRVLGGMDHLVLTVTSNAEPLEPSLAWTPTQLEKLSRIDRCLKVLENVTHQNESNQEYLLRINSGNFGKTLMKLFWLCDKEIPLYSQKNGENPSTSKGLITSLITTLKVLINLTHGSSKEALGSAVLGKDEEIYTLTMNCLLVMPQYLNHDTKFEIQVLSCCLLLNLVEKSKANRDCLMQLRIASDSAFTEDIFRNIEADSRSAISALINLFYSCEESAREQEAHTDNIIEHDLDVDMREEEKKDEEIEETVARLLQKAGRHMEDTLIAAYTALLAGYCLLDNKEYEKEVRGLQPEGHFKTMVIVLKKFLHFMNLTATTSLLRSLKPTEQVVNYMENLDKMENEQKAK